MRGDYQKIQHESGALAEIEPQVLRVHVQLPKGWQLQIVSEGKLYILHEADLRALKGGRKIHY